MYRMSVLERCTVAGLLAALAACGSPRQFPNDGTVKTQSVGPQGGIITVTASDDPVLAGTSITVPPGALSQPVVITIRSSSETVTPLGATTAGPVVDFGPDGTVFAQPVTIQIPVTLPEGATQSQLAIEAVESTGEARRLAVSTVSGGLATFQVSGFTHFGGIVEDEDGGSEDGGLECSTDADCGPCNRCFHGQCAYVASACPPDADGGPFDAGPANFDAGVVDGGPAVDGGYACTSDSDCGSCEACVNGECEGLGVYCPVDGGVSCTTDSDCPSDESCVAGQCQYPVDGGTFCVSDVDCDPCSACFNGQCVYVDSACPFDGGSLDGGSFDGGWRDGGATCASDTDCGGCAACISGRCEGLGIDCSIDGGSACGVDIDCPPNEACQNGTCVPSQPAVDGGVACRTNSDCPSGQLCHSGTCQ